MRVAIAGYGVEGKASYQYWQSQGHEVTIVDERELSAYDLPYGVSAQVGKGAFSHLKDFDLVIRTAGLDPAKLKVPEGRIWSATNEFFDKCPAPIIGVTGTKGKGTTASLITSILRAADKTVHLVGNIGVPALEELPSIESGHIVVYELSSFQLWDLKKSPHVAVVLMVEPDHLDVHHGMDDYVQAKMNIRKWQTAQDVCLYHPTNELSARIAQASEQGQAKRYAVAEEDQVYVTSNNFSVQNHPICSVDALQLVGQHNIENACAALSAARYFTQDNVALEAGLRAFTGLDHRLKLVATVDNTKYYDDSISTTPGSATAAIRAITEPKVLILGGRDKGSDYSDLAYEIKNATAMRAVLCIGENGSKLAELLKAAGVTTEVVTSNARTMKEVVENARELAQEGDAVILSPAAASFDMFKNVYDRGDQFISEVKAL